MNGPRWDRARNLAGIAFGAGCLAALLTLVVVSFAYTITEVPFP